MRPRIAARVERPLVRRPTGGVEAAGEIARLIERRAGARPAGRRGARNADGAAAATPTASPAGARPAGADDRDLCFSHRPPSPALAARQVVVGAEQARAKPTTSELTRVGVTPCSRRGRSHLVGGSGADPHRQLRTAALRVSG